MPDLSQYSIEELKRIARGEPATPDLSSYPVEELKGIARGEVAEPVAGVSRTGLIGRSARTAIGEIGRATGREILGETGQMTREVLTKAYPPETVKQTILGLGMGFAGFGADIYTRVASAAKQFVGTGDIDPALMGKEGEKAAESIAYEVTDPGAQAILTAVSAVPVGIKMAGHAPADLIEELAPGKYPNLVAALRTGGDIGELIAFGKVFHSIKGLGKKAQLKIPTKEEFGELPIEAIERARQRTIDRIWKEYEAEETGFAPKPIPAESIAEAIKARPERAEAIARRIRTPEGRQAEIRRMLGDERAVPLGAEAGIGRPARITTPRAPGLTRAYPVAPRGERGLVRAGPEPEYIPEAEIVPSGLLPPPEGRGPGFEFREPVIRRREPLYRAVEEPTEYPPVYERKGKVVARRAPTAEELRVDEARARKMAEAKVAKKPPVTIEKETPQAKIEHEVKQHVDAAIAADKAGRVKIAKKAAWKARKNAKRVKLANGPDVEKLVDEQLGRLPEVAEKEKASAIVVRKTGTKSPKGILSYYQKKYPELKGVKVRGLEATKESGPLIDEGVSKIILDEKGSLDAKKTTIHLTRDASPITVRHEIEHLLDVIHGRKQKPQTMGRFEHAKFTSEYIKKAEKPPAKVKEPWEMMLAEYSSKEAKSAKRGHEETIAKGGKVGGFMEAAEAYKWPQRVKDAKKAIKDLDLIISGKKESSIYKTMHYRFIERALSQNKSVPAKVLAEYPDLKPPKPEKPKVEVKAEEIKVTGPEEAKEVKVDIPKKEADILAPKEQKKYFLAEIDKAIKEAPEAVDGAKGMVTIHVPGDGDFTILNHKIALEEFKKRARLFPAGPPKKPVYRRTGARSIVREENVYKNILGKMKPEDIKPGEVDTLLKNAADWEVTGQQDFAVLNGFANWLLGKNIKPEVTAKMQELWSKDYLKEAWREELVREETYFKGAKESFEEIRPIVEKMRRKEITIKSALEQTGYKQKKHLLEQYDQRQSWMINAERGYEELSERLVEPKHPPAQTLDMLGMQTAYEKVRDWGKSVKEGKTEKSREILANARKESLSPVKGNPLDKGSVAFLKSEKLEDYWKEMPAIGELKPNEIWRYDATAPEIFAGIETKDGKIKPAIRQSGYHALKQFSDALKGIKDVGKLEASWADPTRFAQKIDQGKFAGPVQKHILWPSRMSTLAKLRWSDLQKAKIQEKIVDRFNIKSNKKAAAVGDVIEHISGRDAWAWIDKESIKGELKADTINKILEIPEVSKALKRFKANEKSDIVQAAMQSRRLFDNWLANQNHARTLRKQPKIPKRKKYRPWVIEANLWSKLLGLKVKPREIIESPEMPDFIKPNQPFNPRAMAREGLLRNYEKKRNIVELMSDYIETAAKDIFDTNVVHSNKIHSAVLRSKGLENAAEGIERWTSEVFAGVAPRVTRVAKEVLPPAARGAMLKIRRNLTRAVFPLNWTWNAFIQTSSGGLTYMRYGNSAMLAGMRYFTNPAVRQAIKQNAYSSIIKQRWGGKAAYQDIQGSILKNKRLDAKTIDKVEDFTNFLTSSVEDALTGHAVAAAMYDGRTRLGLKGRELWEYASEGGAKTQSMYNYQDVPGMLRGKEVGALFPFQTFAFEVFNTVREMNIPGVRKIVGKTGLYETISASSIQGKALMSNRLKMLGRWTAAIIVTNAIVDRAIGRDPWEPSSFIPFLGYVLGGYAGRGPIPHRYIQDAKKGIRDVIVYGNFKRLRKWLVQYHALAGTQINRTFDGIEATSKRGVEDVRGRRLFPVRGAEEQIKAVTMGPYRTKEGIIYLKKIKKRQGIIGGIRQVIEEESEGGRRRRRPSRPRRPRRTR